MLVQMFRPEVSTILSITTNNHLNSGRVLDVFPWLLAPQVMNYAQMAMVRKLGFPMDPENFSNLEAQRCQSFLASTVLITHVGVVVFKLKKLIKKKWQLYMDLHFRSPMWFMLFWLFLLAYAAYGTKLH